MSGSWNLYEDQSNDGYPPDWDARRKAIYRRDDYTCQSCGVRSGPYGDVELHCHHIIPKSQGGSHDASNLTTLCYDCHNAVHSHHIPRGDYGDSGSDADDSARDTSPSEHDASSVGTDISIEELDRRVADELADKYDLDKPLNPSAAKSAFEVGEITLKELERHLGYQRELERKTDLVSYDGNEDRSALDDSQSARDRGQSTNNGGEPSLRLPDKVALAIVVPFPILVLIAIGADAFIFVLVLYTVIALAVITFVNLRMRLTDQGSST